LDPALPRRIDKMVGELVWMARALRGARDEISTVDARTTTPVQCSVCGTAMNQHAEKVDYSVAVDPVFNGVVQQIHQCAACGNIEMRADATGAGREPVHAPSPR